jgi:FkbM family methyltransferase
MMASILQMENKLPLKTSIFNLLRRVFMIDPFEKWLAQQVINKDASSLTYRLMPHNYTYRESDFRIIRRNGVTVKVYLKDYLGHCLYFQYKNPELESYKKLFSLIQPNSNCIDIGSNTGYVALVMAELAPQGRVIGFEPDATNYRRLQENLALNSFPHLEVQNVGLGEMASEESMEVNVENRGRNKVALEYVNANKVKIVKLDDYLGGATVNTIDLIKIDVEGYELKVLKGARATLVKYLPILFIEIDDNNLSQYGDCAKELILFLQGIGYRKLINAQTNHPVTASSDFRNQHFDLIASL